MRIMIPVSYLLDQCVLFDPPLDQAVAISHTQTVHFLSLYLVYLCICALVMQFTYVFPLAIFAHRESDMKTEAQTGRTVPQFPHTWKEMMPSNDGTRAK